MHARRKTCAPVFINIVGTKAIKMTANTVCREMTRTETTVKVTYVGVFAVMYKDMKY